MRKQILIIVVALIGFGIANANCQNSGMCVKTKGVEALVMQPTPSTDYGFVILKNTNPYKVTVEYKIKFVNKQGESFPKSGTITLEGKKSKNIKQSKYKQLDADLTTTKMKVLKCE
jgi:hypothetical protein